MREKKERKKIFESCVGKGRVVKVEDEHESFRFWNKGTVHKPCYLFQDGKGEEKRIIDPNIKEGDGHIIENKEVSNIKNAKEVFSKTGSIHENHYFK